MWFSWDVICTTNTTVLWAVTKDGNTSRIKQWKLFNKMVISCCLSLPLNFDDCLPSRPDFPLIDDTNSPYVRFLKDVAVGQNGIGWTLCPTYSTVVFRLLALHTRDINILTHCGRVKQICVFNTVKLGTSASSP